MYARLETPEVIEQLSAARFNVVAASRFVAFLLFRCDIYVTEDHIEPYDTAMCFYLEKPTVCVSLRFWNSMNDKQRAFVLYHEISHIFLGHIFRAEENKYDPYIFNTAADYYINATAKGEYISHGQIRRDEKFSRYMEMPECGLYAEEFVGMSADQIYHLLLNDAEKIQGVPMESLGHGKSETKMSKSDELKLEETVKAAIHAAEANGIGEGEAQLVRDLKAHFEPVVDYRQYIENVVSASARDMTTYARVSRRNDGDVVFPTYIGDHIAVVIGVDTSGSMSTSDYEKATRAIYDIVSQYESWEISLVSCDTRATEFGVFDSDSGDEFIHAISLIGGGGTDMEPIVDYTNNRIAGGDDIDACIIVTDGYIPESVDAKFDPTISNLMLCTQRTPNLKNCTVVKIDA